MENGKKPDMQTRSKTPYHRHDHQAPDCRAALGLLKKPDRAPTLAREIVARAHELQQGGWTIAFQWLPSDCETKGNEAADTLATHLLSPPPTVTCGPVRPRNPPLFSIKSKAPSMNQTKSETTQKTRGNVEEGYNIQRVAVKVTSLK